MRQRRMAKVSRQCSASRKHEFVLYLKYFEKLGGRDAPHFDCLLLDAEEIRKSIVYLKMSVKNYRILLIEESGVRKDAKVSEMSHKDGRQPSADCLARRIPALLLDGQQFSRLILVSTLPRTLHKSIFRVLVWNLQ